MSMAVSTSSSIQEQGILLQVSSTDILRAIIIESEPNLVDLKRAFQEIWPGRNPTEAMYQNINGEMCSLSEASFADFLNTAKQTYEGQVLDLVLPLHVWKDCSAKAAVRSNYSWCSCSSKIRSPLKRASAQDSSISGDDWEIVEVASDAEADSWEAVSQTEAFEVPSEGTLRINFSHESLHRPSTFKSEEKDWLQVPRTKPSQLALCSSDVNGWHTLTFEATDEVHTTDALQRDMPSMFFERSACADPEIEVQEQVSMIIAAFDADQDGYLDFKESNALHRAAWGGHIPVHIFEEICGMLHADCRLGLSKVSLIQLYSRPCVGTLSVRRDCEVAKAMLEGLPARAPTIAGLNPAWWQGIHTHPCGLRNYLTKVPVTDFRSAQTKLTNSLMTQMKKNRCRLQELL